jgi:hypothetical protein
MFARLVFAGTLAPAALFLAACGGPEWRPLFNGKDMTGWKHVGEGEFSVENGELKTQGGMGLLWYEGEQFGDCVLRVVYKATGRGNAGVFIRIPEKPQDAWYPVHQGYEVQIEDQGDEFHRTGAIYSMSRAETFPASSDSWNTMEIKLEGPVTQVTVNGEIVNTFDGNPAQEREKWYEPQRGPRPDRGYIGLQNHDDNSTVYFREVSVRPLQP